MTSITNIKINNENDNPLSGNEAMYQALEWMKAHRYKLLERFIKEANITDSPSYQLMNSEQSRRSPAMMIGAIIDRLNGQVFPSDVLKAHFVKRLEQGGRLEDFTTRADQFLKILDSTAHLELSGQPQVRDVLLSKTQYILQLFKVCMASAVVEYEMRRSRPTPKLAS